MSVTRAELHDLVERVRPEQLDGAARALSAYAEEQQSPPPWPRSLGMIKDADPKASERVTEYLAEGFGR